MASRPKAIRSVSSVSGKGHKRRLVLARLHSELGAGLNYEGDAVAGDS